MAIYNEILAGRYARALQRLFAIKGTVPAKQLAGEIMALHPLFNGVENRGGEGWNKIGGRISAPPVAGNFSAGRLVNPVGSGVVAVIEKISFALANSTLALTIERPASSGTFPLVGSQLAFDKRAGNQQGLLSDGTCLVQGKNNNAVLLGIIVGLSAGLANTQPDVILTDNSEIPLLPGDSFDVTANAVNTGLDVTFWWRERALEDSEKT